MHPVLFEIGPFTIYAYGFFIAAAFLAGISRATYDARTYGLDDKLVADAAFYVLLFSILGARLFYILINAHYFWANPKEILMFWKGGLVFSGGAIAGVLTGAYFFRQKKEKFSSWLNVFAPALALGQGIGRIGCLAAGCCYGKSCDLPWAITFHNPNSLAPLHMALHPTQIYHILAAWFTFFILLLSKKKLQGDGQLMGLFLILFAISRFTIELFRADYRGSLGSISATQAVSIAAFMIGAWLIFKKTKTN